MSATASLLIPLLVQIGSDAAVAEAFNKDPEALMTEYALTEQEKGVLRNGEFKKLKEIVGNGEIKLIDNYIQAYKQKR